MPDPRATSGDRPADVPSAEPAVDRVDRDALVVVPATEADWEEYRDLRLRALAESPAAFGSTLERERAFDDGVWRERAGSGRTLLARLRGVPVGLVATIEEDGRSDERQIVSMWVDPVVRGSGGGRTLVLAALRAVRAQGARRVTLFVADGNEAAARFYERLGFTSTGERQPLPSDPARREERYAIDV